MHMICRVNVFAFLSVLLMILIGCGGIISSSGLVSANHSVASPSGKFIAEHEDSIDKDGNEQYVIHIVDKEGKNDYQCEIVYRPWDSNFILWADDEDILWGYSGDIGVFCWICEGGKWIKYTSLGKLSPDALYVHGKDDIGKNYYIDINEIPTKTLSVPKLLAEKRPRVFVEETETLYALPCGYTGIGNYHPN